MVSVFEAFVAAALAVLAIPENYVVTQLRVRCPSVVWTANSNRPWLERFERGAALAGCKPKGLQPATTLPPRSK